MNKNKNIVNEGKIVKREKDTNKQQPVSERIRHYASRSDFIRQRSMTVSLILAILLHNFLHYVISPTLLRNAEKGRGRGSKTIAVTI